MITEAPDVREKIASLLDKLDEIQLAELLRHVETFYFVSVMQSKEPLPDYDPEKDPTIGFFSGSPEASSEVKRVARGRRISPEEDANRG
jgi:hypothetical protein